MSERWVIVIPPQSVLTPVPAVDINRPRDQVVSDVRSVLTEYANKILTPDSLRRVLPGVGAILAPRENLRNVDADAQVYSNLIHEADWPDSRYYDEGPPPSFPINQHLIDTNVPAYRKCREVSGKGVIVGVIDSGYYGKHLDLDDKHATLDDGSHAFITTDSYGNVALTKPFDLHSHGTRVCGLIVGEQTGPAPGARIAVANVAKEGCLTFFEAEFAAALDWLVTGQADGLSSSFRGADVINLSGGHKVQVPSYLPLVQYARKTYKVLLVAAIGNDGKDGPGFDDCPAHFPGVVAVGGSDTCGDVWIQTDHRFKPFELATAPKPDICAPGQIAWSCHFKGGHKPTPSGTSFGCAIVTGCVALLLQAHPELCLDPDGLEKKLYCMTIDAVGMRVDIQGHGIVYLKCDDADCEDKAESPATPAT